MAVRLDALLEDAVGRIQLGRNARRRVHDESLVFTQVRNWLATLTERVAGLGRPAGPARRLTAHRARSVHCASSR